MHEHNLDHTESRVRCSQFSIRLETNDLIDFRALEDSLENIQSTSLIRGHGTHPGWHNWFSGRRKRGNLVFLFEGRLSITWRKMSLVELVWVRGVMHTLFWKFPSVGSWTFQFKLYTPPRNSRHLHSIFSKAVRTPSQYSQPATQALFPAAERPIPAPCHNTTDMIEVGGMGHPFMVSCRSQEGLFPTTEEAKSKTDLSAQPHALLLSI